jgi:hypothetical protein
MQTTTTTTTTTVAAAAAAAATINMHRRALNFSGAVKNTHLLHGTDII